MKTVIIRVDPDDVRPGDLAPAAEIIRGGGLVAFPTETVYGLGADALNAGAVMKIFAAKGRPPDNPLIAHIGAVGEAERLAREIPEKAQKLMETFWGGPLTLILKKRPEVPGAVTAGLDTVAVRMPAHSAANALIKAAGTPIAAPSANLSGRPSPTLAEHVAADLFGRVDMIIDGGNAVIGLESTVVDMTGEIPAILRPGAVSADHLRAVVGDVLAGKTEKGAPKSPGMKHAHYKPAAQVFIYENAADISNLDDFERPILIYMGQKPQTNGFFKTYNAGETKEDYAARLFYFLRRADSDGADAVFAFLPDEKGIGAALRDRISRAAGGKSV